MKDFDLYGAKEDVERLIKFIPWLETKKGDSNVSRIYGDGELSSSVTFPVYDATLMSFVNEARNTKLMTDNYPYAYSEAMIKNANDELNIIDSATVKTSGFVCAILSKYILKGMTKGAVWQEGVKNGVYLAALYKLKELLEIWDAPLA